MTCSTYEDLQRIKKKILKNCRKWSLKGPKKMGPTKTVTYSQRIDRHTEALIPEYPIRASVFQVSCRDMSGPIMLVTTRDDHYWGE